MTAGKLAKEIKRLIEAATPKDGSAPVNPVLELGNLVISYGPKIVASLESKARRET